MEGFGGPKFSNTTSVMKKKRSTKSRRPRPDSQFLIESRDTSSHSSTPSSENGINYAPRIASLSSISTSRRIRKEEKYGDLSGFYGNGSDIKRSSEGVLALPNWKSSSSGSIEVGNNNLSIENKPKKVKLKVGGVTRTFHPKANLEIDNSGYNLNDSSRHGQNLTLQDNSDDDSTPAVKTDSSTIEEHAPHSEPVRKSKRVPKRRVLDGELNVGPKVDEIHHEKVRSSNNNSDIEDTGHKTVKKNNGSKISRSKKMPYAVDEDYSSSSRSLRESIKKSRTRKEFDDMEYVEEEEIGPENRINSRKEKQKKEFVETLNEARIEPLTTRQRALQSGKGASGGDSLIEFPDGLPPAPSRKQKEKLTEVEQQARKAEAAQRRRMQVEKANKESEAEAIRKILGQDSNRKRKEDKLRKERDELAQKKAAEALVLAPDSIRCVMGPTGTIVTFGEDVNLLSMFESKTSSYPPPREKCAAPSCPNAYKYRDSKLNLPLCSLQCYKTVQESSQTISTI